MELKEIEIKRYMLIHRAIHNPKIVAVIINHDTYEIKTSSVNGCRFVTWNGNTFMQANPTLTTAQGRLAAEGHSVTWIMRTARKSWGLIIDDTIKRP